MKSSLSNLKIFFVILSVIPNKKKFYILYLIIFALFASVTEIISVASLFPLLEIMFNTETYLENNRVEKIIQFLKGETVGDIKLKILLIFICLVFVSFVVKILLILATNYISMNIGHIIMSSVFKKTINKNYSYFVDSHSSKFLSNLERSSNTQAFIEHFLQILVALILLTVIILFTLSLNFKILLSIFLFVGGSYITIFFILKSFNKKISETYNLQIENRIKIINETFNNIKEIIIGKLHNLFINQFIKTNLSYIKAVFKNTLITNIPGNFIVFISIISLTYLIYYFSNQPTDIKNIIPLFGTIIFALQKILNQSQLIYSNYVKMKFNINSAIDITNIITEKEQIKNYVKKKLYFKNTIEIKNGNFKYNTQKKHILKNFNLKIEKNSIIIIDGLSGSGKTTLVNILTGLIKLNSGSILIDGKELTDENIESWYDKIGYLSQNTQLLDDTILNNITLKNNGKIDNLKLDQSVNISGLNKLIAENKEGINTLVGEQGKKISGGQRQRIIIARTIYNDKDILFFDEATNALDEKSEEIIFKNISSLKEKTIIIISHRKSLKLEKYKKISLNLPA